LYPVNTGVVDVVGVELTGVVPVGDVVVFEVGVVGFVVLDWVVDVVRVGLTGVELVGEVPVFEGVVVGFVSVV